MGTLRRPLLALLCEQLDLCTPAENATVVAILDVIRSRLNADTTPANVNEVLRIMGHLVYDAALDQTATMRTLADELGIDLYPDATLDQSKTVAERQLRAARDDDY